MRHIEKEKAIILRKEGKSIKEITKLLKVSKSSVSVWVRDIALSKEQLDSLYGRRGAPNGAKVIKEKYTQIRRGYQKDGVEMAAQITQPLFVAGCMLYWAEGTKSRNSLQFVNSDPVMIQMFMQFLRIYFQVPNEKITISLRYYTNDIANFEQIKAFWLNKTDLPEAQIRDCRADVQPKSSQKKKKNKLPYGVCRIGINSSEILQKIYGAISYYSNQKEFCLDGRVVQWENAALTMQR